MTLAGWPVLIRGGQGDGCVRALGDPLVPAVVVEVRGGVADVRGVHLRADKFSAYCTVNTMTDAVAAG